MELKEAMELVEDIKQLGIKAAVAEGHEDAPDSFDSISFHSKHGFIVSFTTPYMYGKVKYEVWLPGDLLTKTPEEIVEHYRKIKEEREAERERIRLVTNEWRNKMKNMSYLPYVEDFEPIQNGPCECKQEWMTHHTDYDTFPYGDNVDYDLCSKCGKKHNFKVR